MPEAEPARPAVRVDAPEGADLKLTLEWISLLVGVASIVVMVVDLALAPPGQNEAWVAGLMASVGWLCWWLLRSGRMPPEPVAVLIVLGVLGTATFSVLSFGSVRTAVNFLFVGAVVGAGIFLGRNALLFTWLTAVLLLGVLTWAEATGNLGNRANFDVGLRVWMTQSVALAMVGLMVMHSRAVQLRSTGRLRAELEKRRQTEQQRDRSLLRFARIFRTSPSPMIAQSARTGSILDVNPAFERFYGYTRNQVVGRPDQFLWADALEREQYIQRLTTERHIDQYRTQGRRADGSVFDALVSSEMGRDEEDRLIISTVTDVTGQDEALERLRRSEARFAKAFNFSPLNLTITRLSDGTFIEVNNAEDRVQGMTPDELKGRTTVEVGAWLTPQHRERFVEQLVRDGRVDGYDTRMRHRDGTLVDTRLWAELIELDGEMCILSCTTNITEEKRREALLMEVARGVAGETGEAFLSAVTGHLGRATGADMVVVAETVGGGALQTLAVWRDGGSSRNFRFSAPGTPCAETMERTDLMVCATHLADSYPDAPQLREQGFQTYLGQSLRDADGRPIGILLALWRAQMDVKPDLQALVSIFASRVNAELLRLHRDREIERLNDTLEQRVRDRTAELQHLNAELDAFAYSVSHDLKSPLRAIDGFTQLLQERLTDRLSEEEQQLFQRVLGSSQRMGAIINDLLSLARVSQGVLQRQPVDMSELARSVMDQELSRQPVRRVQHRLQPGVVIDCDPQLARIVLENLFSNALKYSRQRDESLIEWGLMPRTEGEPARMFVRDNGVGFDMAHADKLFKPFQRLHRERDFEGTGIGLATVRRILERHGGSIVAEGRVNDGATFVFSFGGSTSA